MMRCRFNNEQFFIATPVLASETITIPICKKFSLYKYIIINRKVKY